MDFRYTEELLEIKRVVREFAESEIRPHVLDWDEKQIFPRDVLKKLAELGFMGVLIPTEYSGAGLGYVEYVAIAVTDKSAGHRGISAFILERGMPGFSAGKKENKLGLRASDTSTVVFEDCRVPHENLLGEAGSGFIDALKVLDGGRISIAALAVGMAQGAYEAALQYAKQRKQFGRPIADFQAIQFKLADMATEIDAARLLTYRAAWMKDQGMQTTEQSSRAKLYAGEVAVRVANECVQIHGGYGYIKEYPAEKFYRDVKLCTIGEGTSEIQRLVIAREILRQ